MSAAWHLALNDGMTLRGHGALELRVALAAFGHRVAPEEAKRIEGVLHALIAAAAPTLPPPPGDGGEGDDGR